MFSFYCFPNIIHQQPQWQNYNPNQGDSHKACVCSDILKKRTEDRC